MNNVLIFLQNYSKTLVQLFGVYLIYKSFSNNKTIADKSGTYFNFNIHLAKSFISEDYNKFIALMVLTLPEVLDSFNINGFYIYSLLILGILSQISGIKNHFVNKRINKIKSIIQENLENE